MDPQQRTVIPFDFSLEKRGIPFTELAINPCEERKDTCSLKPERHGSIEKIENRKPEETFSSIDSSFKQTHPAKNYDSNRTTLFHPLWLSDDRTQNLFKWRKVRQTVFSEDAPTLGEYGQFASIVNYCRKNGIDLQEGVEVALRIGGGASSEEKGYALMISSLLLGLQKNTALPFYRAHKDFIDTVLVKIKEGKLNLRKVNEDKRALSSTAAEYYPKTNSIFFNQDLNFTTLNDIRVILHELYHFYQDIRKESPMIVPREMEAYLLAAEWWLYQNPELFENEGRMLEFQRKMSSESFYKQGLPAVYYRLKGDRVKSEQYRRALADDLADFFLSTDFKIYQPKTLKLMEETERKIKKIHGSKQRLQEIENLYRAHHRLFIKELTNYLRLEKAPPEVDRSEKVNRLIFLVQAHIFLDQLKNKTAKGIFPTEYPSRFEFPLDQLTLTTQSVYAALFLLKPKATAYGHPFDGVD